MNAFDFKSFTEAAYPVIEAGFPVMIRGAHGIGKSELVYQIAEKMGLPVVERRASQMTEGDLVGMPKVKGKVTAWLPPEFYYEACDKPVILFLDELDRALTEVRQGFFELADSRKLNGHKLHPDTRLISAINGGKSGQHYQVFEMGPAEIDRWWTADVEPTVDDWLTWAYDKVEKPIWEFINSNNGHLEHKSSFDPTLVYPSRRSWVRFNKTIKESNLFQKGKEELLFNIGSGFIGFEASAALREFLSDYSFVVSVEELLDLTDATKEKILKFEIQDHMAMVRRFKEHPVLNERVITKEEADNLNWYANHIPDELLIPLIQVFAINSKFADNIIRFHGAGKKGTDLGSLVVRLFENGDEQGLIDKTKDFHNEGSTQEG